MKNYNKTKGKKFEDKIAEKIHNICWEKILEYREIYNIYNDPKLKPRRDASSGSSNDSDGDINLGLCFKYLPISIECKDWKVLDISLNSIIKGKIKTLQKIYEEQAKEKTSERLEKTIIVFKALRTDVFVMFKDEDFDIDLSEMKNFVYVEEFFICKFDSFLESQIKRYLNT